MNTEKTDSKTLKTSTKSAKQQLLSFNISKIVSPASTKDGSMASGAETVTNVIITVSNSPDSNLEDQEDLEVREEAGSS